jgi:hypothetical protein
MIEFSSFNAEKVELLGKRAKANDRTHPELLASKCEWFVVEPEEVQPQ